jgi:hypothetical protein
MMMTMMSVEQSVECLEGETEVLGENQSQRRSVHHKSTEPLFEALNYGKESL